MKKALFLSLMLGFSAITFSQNPNLTLEPVLSDKQRTWLNLQGIPVNTYNWKNPQINENLNLALKYNKKARGFKTGGWIAASVGVGVITSLGVYLLEDAGSPGGIVLGTLMVGGSIPLFVIGKQNDRKSDSHISKAISGLRSN